MKNEKLMREGSVWELLLKMSLPVILVMMVTVLYNLADVFFIGRFGDRNQLAAISLAGPVFTTISAFNTLIGFGSCTACAIALGEGREDRMRQFSAFALYASLGLGVLLGGGVLLGMGPLLGLLGTDGDTAGYTAEYLQILAIGAPIMITGGALGNTVRSDGDVKTAMVASMTGTVLNVVLDPVFIALLRWGCRGAALATVIGNAVSLVILLLTAGKKSSYSLSIRDFTLHRDVSLRVLGLGLPMAASTLLMSFTSAVSNRLTVGYGTVAVAARSVAGKSAMLIPMVVMGLCMGVQPAISYVYGCRDLPRLKKITLGVGAVSVGVALAMSAAFFLLRQQFVAAFSSDAEIIALGKAMMLGTLVAVPIEGVYQMCTTYLQATGKVSYATLTSLMQKGLVFLPVLLVMEHFLGLNGIVFTNAVTTVISTCIALLLCRRWTKQIAAQSV
ncbi:MAG: MATE family efflux transporter [Oscillospiraceae bacterium]|nr:MATE family efflux transporter [Oscillospiraceae bacterium]